MPTNVTYPGVYVEESPAGVRPIAGVPTSIAAFVGHAVAGPVNDPARVFSLTEFERMFGSEESDLHQAIRLFFANGGSAAFVVGAAAEDLLPIPAELERARTDGTGLFALDAVDMFNILLAPGQSDPLIHAAMAKYAKERRAFAILDLPATADTPTLAEQWFSENDLLGSPNAATYFPGLQVQDSTGGKRSCSSSGAIAGVYARTDIARGVWKAPAGMEAVLRGAIDLGYPMSSAESDRLNSIGINPLRTLDQDLIVWGARTLDGANSRASEWKYVPVRRLALFIEESIDRGTQWVVFEPNDEPLWARIRLNVETFMHSLFRQGAFQGATPRDAYFVKCDRTTITQSDIDMGVVNIVVGFAPLKPAEFVIVTIQQIAKP